MNITQKAKLSIATMALISFLPLLCWDLNSTLPKYQGWILYFILVLGTFIGLGYYRIYIDNPKKKYFLPLELLTGFAIILGLLCSLYLPMEIAAGQLSLFIGFCIFPILYAIPAKNRIGIAAKCLGSIFIGIQLILIIFSLAFAAIIHPNYHSMFGNYWIHTYYLLTILTGIMLMILGLNHDEAVELPN